MHSLAMILGIVLFLGVTLDAFQTIILPRRPTGHLRLTRLFYLTTWGPWAAATRRIRNPRRREQVYSIYGPLSLILLLVVWALLLITGFAFVYYALHTPFKDDMMSRYDGAQLGIWTDFYVSGTTLFTLGLGDVIPQMPFARAIIILESGVGLGLVALVVGYLPVLYGAFSRREVLVAMLDARAGSPPTAAELLSRHSFEGGDKDLVALLAEWERWAAELLESHVSYPILCYYRSQHDNQSWLAALVAVLDACALLIASSLGKTASSSSARQAQLTFAMARHAIIDLGHVFEVEEDAKALAQSNTQSGTADSNNFSAHATLPSALHPSDPSSQPATGRLSATDFRRLCAALGSSDIQLCGDPDSATRLTQLRQMYEPNAQALAAFLGLSLPLWITEPSDKDQWRKVANLRSLPDAPPSLTPVSPQSTAARLHEEEHTH